MGSLYRSKHELLTLSTKGGAPYVNNVGLGKNGRSRSNVWVYPGASSLGSDARRGLQEHPTVKPVAMLKDALLDLTNRGDLVIDPFLGSGSTLIAAEHTGRQCRGAEIDPLYVDVIIRRYEAVTGSKAILEETGENFEQLVARRSMEGAIEFDFGEPEPKAESSSSGASNAAVNPKGRLNIRNSRRPKPKLNHSAGPER
jgi:DNA methylase